MIIAVSKIIFILSILGVLFIVSRKIPALSRLPQESLVGRLSLKSIFNFGWLRNFINKIVFSNFFQSGLVGNLEKSLRKFKIAALKVDNIIDRFLRSLKRNSENGNKPS